MWAFSLYNYIMKEKIVQRLAILSQEVESLMQERQDMQRRDQEIEIRLHQLVGSIYELQHLIADLDRQPSEQIFEDFGVEPVLVQNQSTHPSGDVVQDSHQEQLEETEKNSQQQS